MDRVELSIDGTRYLSSLRFFSSLLPHLAPLHSHLNFCLFLFFPRLCISFSNSRRTNKFLNRLYKHLETINKKRGKESGGKISFC